MSATQKFLQEYEQLIHKHGLMVTSIGYQPAVGPMAQGYKGYKMFFCETTPGHALFLFGDDIDQFTSEDMAWQQVTPTKSEEEVPTTDEAVDEEVDEEVDEDVPAPRKSDE